MPDTEVLTQPTDPIVEDEPVPGEAEEPIAPADAEEEAVPDVDALNEAIEALGPDDPHVQQLREKIAPPTVDEERLQWETEKERQERLGMVSAAQRYYAAFEPQAVYQNAYEQAYQTTQSWADSVQAMAQAIFNGQDGAPDPTKQWVFDADAAAQAVAGLVAELVEQAKPAAQSWNSSRMMDVLITDWENSDVHKHLTKEDRAAIKQAKALPYSDQRMARIQAIYRDAAVRGGPQIREKQAKAQAEAEKEKNRHREVLSAHLMGRGAITNGAGGNFRGEAALLADPNTPVSTLIEIRRRQQARG